MTKIKVIQSDSRQKRKCHEAKEKYFAEQGIKVINSKMVCGDYCLPTNQSVVIDTKANITELYGNLIQDHERFRNECILAQELGMKLIVLVENKDGITMAAELTKWKNPQYFRYWKAKKKADKTGVKPPKPPASNIQLIKIMHSMNRDYGVEFRFCKPEEAGEIIIEILEGLIDV